MNNARILNYVANLWYALNVNEMIHEDNNIVKITMIHFIIFMFRI